MTALLESTNPGGQALFITRIKVDGLFGRYSYDLDCAAGTYETSKLLLLYGENGTGKTTLLTLIYHLLSRELGKGHRTFLAKSRFRRLSVYLRDGMELTARRSGQELTGSFLMEMRFKSDKHSFLFKIDKDGDIPIGSNDPDLVAFTNHLPDISLYFLPDDRKISTDIELQDRELESTQLEIKYLRRLSADVSARGISKAESVLGRVVQWIREQALAGSNAGQLNVNSIYSEIVAGLAVPTSAKRVSLSAEQLVDVLEKQATRNHEYSKYGLTSELPVKDLVRSIRQSREKKSRISVIAQILKPYIDGNEARLKALEPVQKAVETFVRSINNFYTDKKVAFTLRQGMQILSKDGEILKPQVLSSGEKQLLILFCNVIMTGAKPAIFIIDEPELSLNVKWQRQLVDSLLACVSGAPVQFVFATHSLELLARHRRNVVRLTPNVLSAPSEPLLFAEN